MGVLELIQQKSFLGKEFLTWLWFRSERGPNFELKNGRMAEVELMAPIVLSAQYGDARSSALRGDSPATSPEARTALLEGKKLERARIKIACEGVEWIAGLDGEKLSIAGLNMPRAGQLPVEEQLRMRVEFLLDYEAILAELFAGFLELRLDPKAWKGELKRVQAWVEGNNEEN